MGKEERRGGEEGESGGIWVLGQQAQTDTTNKVKQESEGKMARRKASII
jgi:hypothetical protein